MFYLHFLPRWGTNSSSKLRLTVLSFWRLKTNRTNWIHFQALTGAYIAMLGIQMWFRTILKGTVIFFRYSQIQITGWWYTAEIHSAFSYILLIQSQIFFAPNFFENCLKMLQLLHQIVKKKLPSPTKKIFVSSELSIFNRNIKP